MDNLKYFLLSISIIKSKVTPTKSRSQVYSAW